MRGSILIIAACLSSAVGAQDQTPHGEVPQHGAFLQWTRDKIAHIRSIDFQNASQLVRLTEPEPVRANEWRAPALSALEEARISNSANLYFQTFGRGDRSAFLWAGVESANPRTSDDSYRWDSLEVSGLYDAQLRAKIIGQLHSWNIRGLRLGMPNHKLVLSDESSWRQIDEIIDDLSRAGIKISLDLHHFGIEDQFKAYDASGSPDWEHSYYLNPDWPAYFATYAAFVAKRYAGKVAAMTLINEPETTVGFNGQLWHGGFPGWHSAPGVKNRYYIERALKIGLAAVLARTAIEEVEAREHLRPIAFVHNEAAVYKGYWPEFNHAIRYVPSDLILGDDWFLKEDIGVLTHMPLGELESEWVNHPSGRSGALAWMIREFIFGDMGSPELSGAAAREARRKILLTNLAKLKDAHLQLEKQFGLEMKSGTIFAADYYAQNEDLDQDLKPP